jgi:hypothetical protein
MSTEAWVARAALAQSRALRAVDFDQTDALVSAPGSSGRDGVGESSVITRGCAHQTE